MTWFRLDDSFHSHPKILKAGNEAIGLYVRCGTYAAQHLTDGIIPEHIAYLYGSEQLVDTLVSAGLWRRARGGWRMPDYLEYNPSRIQVEAEREKNRERQRASRKRRSHPESSRHDHAMTTTVSHAAPSRPVPSPSGTGGELPHGGARASPEPPQKCPTHINDPDPPNCGACADARRAHQDAAAKKRQRVADAPKCRAHRGELAHNCRLCRADQLAAEEPTR